MRAWVQENTKRDAAPWRRRAWERRQGQIDDGSNALVAVVGLAGALGLVGAKAVERQAEPTSRMGRFESELASIEENPSVLSDLAGVRIDRVHDQHPPKMILLDMNGCINPTYGDQAGSARRSIALVFQFELQTRCCRLLDPSWHQSSASIHQPPLTRQRVLSPWTGSEPGSVTVIS